MLIPAPTVVGRCCNSPFNTGVDGERVAFQSARRSLYACNDCQQTWRTVCDEGVPSVCDLVDYGSPILTTSEESIATMCETLGAACSSSGSIEACDGQCEEDDDSTGKGARLQPCQACIDSVLIYYHTGGKLDLSLL